MKNLLIFTDIGDDIDDSLAITHLQEHTDHHICAVITSHGDIDYRINSARELFHFFDAPPPLIAGTKNTFIRNSTQASDRLVQEIMQYIPKNEQITILCLCAATDLEHLLRTAPDIHHQIEKIRYQGIIDQTDIGLQPDLHSYNFKTDPEAIRFCLTTKLPCQRITKHEAYKHPFREDDLLQFTKKADLNEYLLSKAVERQSRFKLLNDAKRQEVYGSDPTVLSYPYDLLVAQQV